MKEEESIDTSRKISFNLSTILESLPQIKKVDLSPTEQKIYLRLAVDFESMSNHSESYLKAVNKWNNELDERLQSFGLTNDEWKRISVIGDNTKEIQDQVNELIEKLEKFDYF
jgi:hypothetical protein